MKRMSAQSYRNIKISFASVSITLFLLAMFWTTMFASAADTAQFQSAVNYTVEDKPISSSAGDLNNDGKLDLVVTNQASNSISVLLGVGDGTFQAAVNYVVGVTPWSVTNGDFNGDGALDLAVANRNSSDIAVLLGTGSGSFAPAVNYPGLAEPMSIATSDFNDDGALDVVVANRGSWWSSGNISILLGAGNGTFAAPANYATGLRSHSVTCGDFNGDGAVDLAVANWDSGNVSVLMGVGNGSFQAAVNYTAGVRPNSIALNDFNNDGKSDLVVANYVSNNVSILLGVGNGTFQTSVNYPAGNGVTSVTTGDYNMDGKNDVAATNNISSSIQVLLGVGDGTFKSPVSYPAGSDGVTTADFNMDGKSDLAVPNYLSDQVAILLNITDTIAPTVTYTGPSGWLNTADNTVTATFTDPAPTSGIAGATLSLNGGAPEPCDISGGSVSCAAAGLADGHYDALVTVSDNAGNSGTATGAFDVDTIAPVTSATGLSDSWTNAASVNVTFACADTGGSGCTTTPTQYSTDDGATWTTGTSLDISAAGDTTVQYRSTDNAGNTETIQSGHVRIDRTAPTITVSATKADSTPYTAGTWTNQDVTVHFDCADTGGSGLKDGTDGCPADVVRSATAASTSGTATDNAGNSASASFGQIKIDKIAPIITGIQPSGTIYSGSALVWSAYIESGGSGINTAAVWQTLDGGAPLTGCSVNYAQVVCNVTGLAYGPHYIGGQVADNAGNVSLLYDWFIVGDNVAPAVTYTGPSGWLNTADNTVTATFTDPAPTSGIAGATLSLNGGDPQPCDIEDGNVSCANTGLADGHYDALVTVSDNAGNSGTATGAFDVDTTAPVISNVAPSGIINTNGPNISADYADEGSGINMASVSVTLDGATINGCTVDESHVNCPAVGLAYGSHEIGVEVTDNTGITGAISGYFYINSAPVIMNAGNVSTEEGSTAANTGTFIDADTDTVTLSASAGTVTNNSDGTWSWTMPVDDGPADSQTVTITADDGNGGMAATSFNLTVTNVAPVMDSVSGPEAPVSVGTALTVNADFHDNGTLDTHTVRYYWGDGTNSQGTVNESGGSGSVSATHSYISAGVYTVKLTVTDSDGASGETTYEYVVIYDQGAGFVTGGGWINSPTGAYAADPSMTGKASFGFVSKYQKGAVVPSGNTEFQFKAGNLNFHSTSYDWLVIAGAKAQYKGTGTINGSGCYGFMLTATDGQLTGGWGMDRFRIKIWDKDTGMVVYDNMMGAAQTDNPITMLGGGSIVIHK